jgi:methionine synthase II (cobalamin-independent)
MSGFPLLPTGVVGSHGKPDWWYAAVKAHGAGELGPVDLDEMFDDAADTAIREMERAGPWDPDQLTQHEAIGRIGTPPGGLGIIKEFEYLKAHTTKPTKATCPGPLTFGSRILPKELAG